MADAVPDLLKQAKSYYESILADFESAPAPDPEDKVAVKAAEDAKAITARYPNIGWKDIYVLELAVVRLQPIEKLRRRAWILRAKFKSTVGAEVYAAYEASKPPDPAIASPADLRADLEKILEEFHWLYTSGRARDERLKDLKLWLTLLMFVPFAFLLLTTFQFEKISTLGIIVFTGMAGSLMSIVRRLQDVVAKPLSTSDPVLVQSGLDTGFVGIVLALLSGAVFATLLYMLFIAGMSDIAGKLVPEIAVDGDITKCGTTFSTFVTCTGPKSGIDFAKLVVWSFLAGFAERLVPDVLDRITQNAQKAADTAKK
ncbi:MAG: hypothetical protein HY067_10510 [Betaproteobacteria bacterium]|nr:hypothetical protein [Betaproteobacteria bacterium]